MLKTPDISYAQPLTHSLSLPAGYRLHELLAFHRRDVQQLAEWVGHPAQGAPVLHKAIDWQGQPAWMTLQWSASEALCAGVVAEIDQKTLALAAAADNGTSTRPRWYVTASLYRSAHPSAAPASSASHEMAAAQQWAGTVRRMLGLAYPPQGLELQHGLHPELGPLLQRQQGLHVPASPTVWEAITWAITGQQISVAAAVALRRRLIAAAGVRIAAPPSVLHRREVPCPEVLWAYPNAEQVAALGAQGLRSAGFSQSKSRALLALAELVCAGDLPLQQWQQASDAGTWDVADVDAVARALQAVPGIGPWTVHYTLLRGLGWPDGSLHGDVAVRKALAQLKGTQRVTEAQTRDWLAQFAPWRALVAAHLWASLSAKAY